MTTFYNYLSYAICALLMTNGVIVAFELEPDDFQRVSQLSEPPKLTALIVRSVRTIVEQSHVLGPEFNDEISSRGFETFLMRIDPAKSYFLEVVPRT